jgi:V/A-type H+-transporting ATPase subunit I
VSLRPQPARWFELLTAREDLTVAVEALARTNRVELEVHGETTARMTTPDPEKSLEEYHRLAQRYQQYWPREKSPPDALPERSVQVTDVAMARLYAWRDEANPLIQKIESLRAERAELDLIEEMLENLGEARLSLGLMARAGPALAASTYVIPPHTRISQLPAGVIHRRVITPLHEFFLALGPRDEIALLEQDLSALRGRHLSLPSWLSSTRSDNQEQIKQRLVEIERQSGHLLAELERLSDKHRLSSAVSDIARLDWFLSNVSRLPVSENFAWVTGWTNDLGDGDLDRALSRAGVRAVLRFPDPPGAARAPMVLENPWWSRPFELFARLLGTPGRNEADPSPILAVLAPLLFGYMFGDVGQGLVLFVLGLVLQRRWPALRLLVAGGLSAMVFGVVFGSVFGREDLISPLWVHPLEHPLPVIIVPLFGGVVILMLGLVLNALEAYWRDETGTWARSDAALLTLYAGLVASILNPTAGMAISTVAIVWYLAGSIWESRIGGMSLPSAIAHLFETVLQLLVNTVSFARVGAFALAHAGLSLAIVTIAEIAEYPIVAFMIMVLGNILVIVLEGLIVSVQTTRLVLFEFFIRFLRGEGRVFRPLTPPSSRHA